MEGDLTGELIGDVERGWTRGDRKEARTLSGGLGTRLSSERLFG